MSFESFEHVLITEELLRHVWDGEEDPTQGGHRYGLGRDGKTEFPEQWDISMVEHAIRATLTQPQSIRKRGIEITCLRLVGGVVMKVVLRSKNDGPVIHAVYPECGDGVFRNERGIPTALPLDFSVLEF